MASLSAVYMCPLCDCTFTAKDVYKQHMFKVHQTTLAGETTIEQPSQKSRITILDVNKPSVSLSRLTDAASAGVEHTGDKNIIDFNNLKSHRNLQTSSKDCSADLDSALGVECGPNEAYLCLKRLAQARNVESSNSCKCIFFSDTWFTPGDFIETSIRASLVEWQEFIYHNKRTIKWLFDHQVVSLSPPVCLCDGCKQNKTWGAAATSEKKNVTRLDSDETPTRQMKEDTSVAKPIRRTSPTDSAANTDGRPPGSEFALPVQCGPNKAWFCIGRLREPTDKKSIYFDKHWITPTAFAEQSDLGWLHNWKLAIKHQGSSLFALLNDKIVTISPPSCHCKICSTTKPNQSDDSSPSSSIGSDGAMDHLDMSEGEDDEATAIMAAAGTMLPEEYEVCGAIWVLKVDCGPNTAWMCIGLLSQVRFEKEKKCVLFEGRWLTPAEFMHVSGRGALRSWKGAIRHHSRNLDTMFKSATITISPPACHCDLCNEGSSRAQRYVCTFCSNTFSTEDTCMTHISKAHPSEKLTTESVSKGTKTKQASSTEPKKDEVKEVLSGAKDVNVASTSRMKRNNDEISASWKINVGKKLISEYGRYPPGKDSLLPVEIGARRGWLDLSCLIENSTATLGKSVYHAEEWIHVQEFRKRAGQEARGNWMAGVKHFGRTINSLIASKSLIISTRSCSCVECTQNPEEESEDEPEPKSKIEHVNPPETKPKSAPVNPPEGKPKSGPVNALPPTPSSKAELVRVYGECPADEDVGLPVECGRVKGWLYMKYFDQINPKRTGDCIYSNGKWYNRNQFKNMGGLGHRADWKLCVTHYGKMINGLVKNQTLVMSPPSCTCTNCIAAGTGDLQINSSMTNNDDNLVWLYGECPPDVEYVLPIECGPQNGWLCLEYIDESSAAECIYSYGEWYTRGQFKELGGYDARGNWRLFFKHFGVSLYTLLKDGTLTLSPPSCTCSHCSGNATEDYSPLEAEEEETGRSNLSMDDAEAPTQRSSHLIPDPNQTSSEGLGDTAPEATTTGTRTTNKSVLSKYVNQELVKQYGERPPDEDFALPIECGSKRGWLCMQYFNTADPARTLECVYSFGTWYKRGQFKTLAGFQNENWKGVFKHFGQKYWNLEKSNILSISPPSCRCEKCLMHDPEAESPSASPAGAEADSPASSPPTQEPPIDSGPGYTEDELIEEYGERPLNADFTLPIECGTNRGWLHIESSMEPQERRGKIYSYGKWYDRTEFKKLSGYQIGTNWRFVIRHFGQRYADLELKNFLTFSPPSCRCHNCSGNQEVNTVRVTNKLMEEYGECPPNVKHTLPIECGYDKGWLCLENIDGSDPLKTGECIYSQGRWYTCQQFKTKCGYHDTDGWEHVIRHFGETYKSLVDYNILSISPPSCSCLQCSRVSPGDEQASQEPKAKVCEVDMGDELVKKYGERPPNGDYGLPVEAGSMAGWLCLEYINEENPKLTGACIYSHGNWYTRGNFKNLGGCQGQPSWKLAVKHFGYTYQSLVENSIVTLSPPSCSCDRCIGNEPTDVQETQGPKEIVTEDADDKLVKEYGKRPPNGEYGLPVEAGSMTGWLCLEYINEENPLKTGACIYSHGDWYKRNNFKNLGGCPSNLSWQYAVRHFGCSYKSLVEKYIVTLSPPSCSCDRCVDNVPEEDVPSVSPETNEPKRKRGRPSSTGAKLKGYSTYDADFLKEYGEGPPGEDHLLPVECGDLRGWLCMQYINQNSVSTEHEVIYCHGRWYTVVQFKNLEGSNANWQMTVRHHGQYIDTLRRQNQLSFSPPSCLCRACFPRESPGTSDSSYGECHPAMKFALQIECGTQKGWLCLEFKDKSLPGFSGACIYSNGDWFTRSSFKKHCGFETGSWDGYIRHSGRTMKALLENGTITLSPPTCCCWKCTGNGSMIETHPSEVFEEPTPKRARTSVDRSDVSREEAFPRYTPEELVQEYGERPPDEAFALPIECGPVKGWICVQYFKEWPMTTGECVYSQGYWYTRTQFLKHNLQPATNWSKYYKHFGKSLFTLLGNNVITISPPSCSCINCIAPQSSRSSPIAASGSGPSRTGSPGSSAKGETAPLPKRGRMSLEEAEALATSLSQSDLTVTYGERPPDELYTLPIECGPKRGWLCLQYVNESDPMSAGEVIYAFGKWYTRTQFRKLGGYENQGDWRKAIRHYGQVLFGLINKNVLTVSPPKCNCDYCPKSALTENSHRTLRMAKLIEEYGERPPDGVYAVPVECGPKKGWLCLEYMDVNSANSTRECIYSHGEWFTRHSFKNLGGFEHYGTWQDGIRHYGKRMKGLLDKNIMTISPPMCKCDFCDENSAAQEDLRNARLIEEYGERPPDGLHAMPVESGTKRGWLCLDYLDEASVAMARECIYSQGEWFICIKFKKLGGFNFGSWDDGIWHFGQLLKGLLRDNVMTITPPCCNCDVCVGHGDFPVSSPTVPFPVSSPTDTEPQQPKQSTSIPKASNKPYHSLIRSVKEYGERPPNGVYAVPVESGPKKGWLCLGYVDETSPMATGECIYSHGEWLTRCKFKKLGGYEHWGDWKKAVWHFGQNVKGLLKHNIMTFSPPLCRCDFCVDNDTKLLREYGERPQDVTFSLPVECGPKRGWMCLQYIDESNPRATGECIYYRGEWYTRFYFKKLGGFESSGDWKASVKHFGRSLKWLLKNNIVSVSPPSCSCEHCSENEALPSRGETNLLPLVSEMNDPAEDETNVLPSGSAANMLPSGSEIRVKKEVIEDDHDTASYVGSARGVEDDFADTASVANIVDIPGNNNHPQLAIQVECSDLTAWMCVGMIASSGQKTKECVLLKGRLLTPFSFMKECGFGGGNWKLNVKHFGESVSLLIADGILTTSPPECACDVCEQDISISQRYVCLQCKKLFTTRAICQEHIGNVHNANPLPDAASSDAFDSVSLVDSIPQVSTPGEQYYEPTYGPELILSVECGTKKAWLCLGYIDRFRKSTEECIIYNGDLILPSQFVELGERHDPEMDWRSCIEHYGIPLISLLDKGMMTLTPPACYCNICRTNNSENSQAYMCSQCFAKFNRIQSCEEHMASKHRLGEPPEGPEFSIPVESGPYNGWMCVGRMKENMEERTGPCILYNGQWLSPTQLAHIAGKRRGGWQTAISHRGTAIKALIRIGSLTASPPACRCKKCKDANAICTTYVCGQCDSTFTTVEAHRDHVILIHNQLPPPAHCEASTSPPELMGASPAKRPRLASPNQGSPRATPSPAKQPRMVSVSQASPPLTSIAGGIVGTMTTLPSPPPAPSLAPRPSLATSIKDLTAEEIFAKLMERKAVFVCTCGIVFRDRVLYYLHKGMHSSDDPYKCSFCGHVAPNWYDFNSHTYTHSSS